MADSQCRPPGSCRAPPPAQLSYCCPPPPTHAHIPTPHEAMTASPTSAPQCCSPRKGALSAMITHKLSQGGLQQLLVAPLNVLTLAVLNALLGGDLCRGG